MSKKDALARGAQSATFYPGEGATGIAAGIQTVELRKKKTLFGRCRDCDFHAYSVEEFSDHIHECPINPVYPPLAEIHARQASKKIVWPEPQPEIVRHGCDAVSGE